MTSSAPSSPAEMDVRTRKLLEGPLPRTLLKLAAPNALVMITQISVGLVELYFVAKLGVDALAGVSQVFPLLALVGAISQGSIGGGVVTAIARSLGRGERQEASDLVWYAVAIALSLGVVTTTALLAGGPHLYTAMGARDDLAHWEATSARLSSWVSRWSVDTGAPQRRIDHVVLDAQPGGWRML
jgi:Na+-driven multidrug efflux pump